MIDYFYNCDIRCTCRIIEIYREGLRGAVDCLVVNIVSDKSWSRSYPDKAGYARWQGYEDVAACDGG